ncbi:MAG: InlB B-repeat-containing protein [Prevotella sp.]|nr:InlB B-repeat-containing protein [Prevotella sp.]
MAKIITLLVLLMTAVTGAWAGTKPTGYIDFCTAHHGSIRVSGWAYDPDQSSVSIQVHAYIWYGTSASGSLMQAVEINADVYRSDVNSAKGITGSHGFERYITVPAGTYTVEIYAIDITGDGTQKLPLASTGNTTATVTEDPYNITYDANGGSDAPDAQQKGENVQLTLRGAEPTREGYTFIEWNTAQDGSGDSYAPGATYTANADVTLYAQWTALPAVNHSANNTWAIAEMPAYDVELEMEYYTELLESNDNSTLLTSLNGETADLWLGRTLQTGGWNTFCVPFSMTLANFKTAIGDDQVQVKELSSSVLSGETLTLNFDDAESIVAGTPYLVKVTDAVANPTFNGVTISKTAQPKETSYANFVPVFSPTNLEGGNTNILFVTGGNTLTYPAANGNINGFRAYFLLHDLPSGARTFALNFEDATGISTVLSDKSTTVSGTYTLDGRRIEGQPTQKGVYIVNGKKNVIK